MRKVRITVVLVIAVVMVMVVLLPESVEGRRRRAYRRIAYSNRVCATITNRTMSNHAPTPADEDRIFFVLLFNAVIGLAVIIGLLMEKTSLIIIQVAVKGDPELQQDLFFISKVANASHTRYKYKRLKLMVSETVSRLLRHPDCFYSANLSVDVIRLVKGSWKKTFDRFCAEESKQFDGRKVTLRGARRCNDFVVVTILVAASGAHNMPEINSDIDLEKALVYLKSINPSYIQAVKVIWTPEDGHKKLLKKDIDQHFPLLRPLWNIEVDQLIERRECKEMEKT